MNASNLSERIIELKDRSGNILHHDERKNLFKLAEELEWELGIGTVQPGKKESISVRFYSYKKPTDSEAVQSIGVFSVYRCEGPRYSEYLSMVMATATKRFDERFRNYEDVYRKGYLQGFKHQQRGLVDYYKTAIIEVSEELDRMLQQKERNMEQGPDKIRNTTLTTMSVVIWDIALARLVIGSVGDSAILVGDHETKRVWMAGGQHSTYSAYDLGDLMKTIWWFKDPPRETVRTNETLLTYTSTGSSSYALEDDLENVDEVPHGHSVKLRFDLDDANTLVRTRSPVLQAPKVKNKRVNINSVDGKITLSFANVKKRGRRRCELDGRILTRALGVVNDGPAVNGLSFIRNDVEISVIDLLQNRVDFILLSTPGFMDPLMEFATNHEMLHNEQEMLDRNSRRWDVVYRFENWIHNLHRRPMRMILDHLMDRHHAGKEEWTSYVDSLENLERLVAKKWGHLLYKNLMKNMVNQ